MYSKAYPIVLFRKVYQGGRVCAYIGVLFIHLFKDPQWGNMKGVCKHKK